jgi:hypothetical protein
VDQRGGAIWHRLGEVALCGYVMWHRLGEVALCGCAMWHGLAEVALCGWTIGWLPRGTMVGAHLSGDLC